MKNFTLYYRGFVLQDVVSARDEAAAMKRALKVWTNSGNGTFVLVEDGSPREAYAAAIEKSKEVPK
jgi:hypothetical protein